MNPSRQPYNVIFLILFSTLIIFGVFSLAMAEDQLSVMMTGQSYFSLVTPENTVVEEIQETNSTPGTMETTPGGAEDGTLQAGTDLPSPSITRTAVTGDCFSRKGWVPYTIQEGDTLDKLASSHGVTAAILEVGSCLPSGDPSPGTVIYLPPVEEPTKSSRPTKKVTAEKSATPEPTIYNYSINSTPYAMCMPPEGWQPYLMMEGDSIPALSERYNISIFALQTANCLEPPISAAAGDIIYLPGSPDESGTGTPSPIETSTPTP